MEKYKELYTYSKEAFGREYERFKILEQKATQYLSILTLLIGISGFFVKWVIDSFVPARNCGEWILVALAGLIFLTLAMGWFFAFSVIRIFSLSSPPLNQGMLDFFVAENEDHIYYGLSTDFSKALEENKVVLRDKTNRLIRAYKCICASVLLLILFSISFGAYNWTVKPSRDINMPDKKENKPTPTPPEPQPAGKAPQPSSNVPRPPFEKVEYGEKPLGIRDPLPIKHKM